MGSNKMGDDYTKNESSIRFLFHLFTTCFERGNTVVKCGLVINGRQLP